MTHRNCHARSAQNKNRFFVKNFFIKKLAVLRVLPNNNSKPTSHVWKRNKLKGYNQIESDDRPYNCSFW